MGIAPHDITRVLDAVARGDGHASEELLVLVYAELRRLAKAKMAREAPGQTLQATALVHEAWLRVAGNGESPQPQWRNRAHFFGAAAEAMRRILIDRARDRKRLKRGGGRLRRELDLESLLEADAPPDDLLDLDEALDRLSGVDAQAAALVKLRLFAGLTVEQAASALGVGRRTAERDWTFARTWLFGQLGPRDEPA